MDVERDSETGPARSNGTTPPGAGIARRRGLAYWAGALLGLGLIGLWTGLFVASARQDLMIYGASTWVPTLPCLGGDFKLALDHIVRVQALGLKIYELPGDIYCTLHPYPPMIARCFRWVTWTDPMTASVTWQVALVGFALVGCVGAWRGRRALGLGPVPLALMVAVVLFSSPFLFAVERGQCDPMIIPPLLVAAWLLGRPGAWSEVAAGSLLGLTAWIKYYPGLAVVALLALGKRRGIAAFVAVVGLVGAYDYVGIRESIKAGQLIENRVTLRVGNFHPVSHSLVEYWKLIGFVRDSAILRRVPTPTLAAVLLMPALVLVGRRVARSPARRELTFAYLLWLVSLATFGLPYSNDYNLATLPLAMFCVWDRGDRWLVHLALAASFVWLQPFWLPIDGNLLLVVKLGALYAVGACLHARASLEDREPGPELRSHVYRPAFARVLGPLRARRDSPDR